MEQSQGTAADNFRKVVCGFVDISLQNPEYTRLLVLETKGEGERAAYFHLVFPAMGASIEFPIEGGLLEA